MANVNAQNRTNSSAFRSMLEKHTLTGPNFNEWFRALKLVVRTKKIQDVFETALPPRPVGVGDAPVDPQDLAEWTAKYDRHNEMYNELYQMYGKPLGVELQELIHLFHTCKHGDGTSVSDHFLLMKSYLDQLASLNYTFDDKIAIGFILESLTSDFHGFVQNYNMQLMGKTLSEAKGKGKAKGGQYSYPSKTKKPQPQKKDRPAKEGQCHHCKEIGHWKRNCPIYLAELKKKKSGQMVASTSSGMFMIELYAFPKNSWVYDTGCDTHICNTKQGFRGARKLKRGSLYLYVGNGMRAEVEAIGSFDLYLPNGLIIVLDNCHYAPTITRGVVSTRNALQKDGILKSTDNEPYDKCESCISGKMTKKPFSHKTEKVNDVLGLIHTDVCGPLRHVSKKGASYFITFTDDYSRYGYV
nr:hypothetical protein [Tanacetum cinerariifolium]